MFRWTVKIDVGFRDIFKHAAGAAVDHELYTFQRNCYGSPYGEGSEIFALVFNAVSLRWKGLSAVKTGTFFTCHRGNPRRDGHSAVAIGRLIYIWGGSRPHSGVLHVFDVDADSWSKPEVSGAVPEGASGHSACALGKTMFIYRGNRGILARTADLFKLDTDTMVWSSVDTRGTSPLLHNGFAAATVGKRIFVFGHIGYKKIGVYNFDTETNRWASTPSVQEEDRRSMSWFQSAFAYNGELYLTAGGGFWEMASGKRTSSYLWRFNPETLSWTKVQPKGNGPACLGGVHCCTVGDRVVLFDGDYNCSRQLWILDLKPSLKTLCKEAFIQHGLEQSELPHDVRWELTAMTETDPEARVLPGLYGNETPLFCSF